MTTYVVDRRGIPLLGKEERAEQLVEWSEKWPAGKQWVKDFSFGLRLGFVSAGEFPKMYIHWNQKVFQDYLQKLGGTPERFHIVSYGICVELREGRTQG